MLTTQNSLRPIWIVFILLISQITFAQADESVRKPLFGLTFGVGTNIGQGKLRPMSPGASVYSTLWSQLVGFNVMLPLGNKGALQFDGIARNETYSHLGTLSSDLNIKNNILGVQLAYLHQWVSKEKFSLYGLAGLSMMDSSILSIVNGVKGIFSLSGKWNVISNLSHHSAFGNFELNHFHLTVGIGIHIDD